MNAFDFVISLLYCPKAVHFMRSRFKFGKYHDVLEIGTILTDVCVVYNKTISKHILKLTLVLSYECHM